MNHQGHEPDGTGHEPVANVGPTTLPVPQPGDEDEHAELFELLFPPGAPVSHGARVLRRPEGPAVVGTSGPTAVDDNDEARLPAEAYAHYYPEEHS